MRPLGFVCNGDAWEHVFDILNAAGPEGRTLLLRCGRDVARLGQAAGDHGVAHDRAALEEVAEVAVQAVGAADVGQRRDVNIHLQAKRGQQGKHFQRF